MKIGRREALMVTGGLLLVVVAFLTPRLHLATVTPVIHLSPQEKKGFADAAPIFGWWNAHVGWGTVPAVLIGVAVVLWGPAVAQRLPWRGLTWATWATSLLWAFALAMIDGWQRGFASRLTTKDEYLSAVPLITDIPQAVRGFAHRILDFQPDSWTTHVSGHPPGALLTFVWLDRVGLGGGAWAGLLCLAVGSSAAAAVIVTIRALNDEQTARRAAPFVAAAPTAIWIAVSADGYYAGVVAWSVALLALAVRGTVRRPVLAAAGAGLLAGWAVYLSYGLVLTALLASVVLICSPDRRTARRALVPAMVAALAVAAAFTLAGFWWFDGYTLVQQRYWQGIAAQRPFQYWGWANLAAVVCAIGLGSVAGIGRAFDIAAIKRRSGLHLLVLAALGAIACADISMLSKAEVERIWLPFSVWLTAAPGLLPVSSQRWWLGVNVSGALLLNHVIFTNW